MKYLFNQYINLSGEFWAPYVDGGSNKDLLDYRGFGYISIHFNNSGNQNNLWWLSADINPRKNWGANTNITAACRITGKSNQYLFVRFFQGYGESLLDYNKYTMNVRMGFCIKPNFYNFF
jgi:phospholipase A1